MSGGGGSPGGGGAGRARSAPQAVPAAGAFAVAGNGSGGVRVVHPAQAYSGIGNPEGHRAYCVRIARHNMAGAAGVREGMANLAREIKKAPALTTTQAMRASWRLKRAARKLAGAHEAAARAAVQMAKVRAQVNEELAQGRRKTKSSTFTTN
jgi:hypothetical protein